MVKDKKPMFNADERPVAAETAAALEAKPAAVPAPSASEKSLAGLEAHFERGTWAGRPQWRCKHCDWDTVASPDVMLLHLHQVHLGLDNQPRTIIRANRSGTPVT